MKRGALNKNKASEVKMKNHHNNKYILVEDVHENGHKVNFEEVEISTSTKNHRQIIRESVNMEIFNE